MDRVELYLKGIPVPPLGSFQDHIYRRFMVLDRYRRTQFAKMIAKALVQPNDVEGVNNALKDYLDSEFRIKDVIASDENRMKEEYKEIASMQLVATMHQDGYLIVEDLTSRK